MQAADRQFGVVRNRAAVAVMSDIKRTRNQPTS